jgi:prevent-host-death family protein
MVMKQVNSGAAGRSRRLGVAEAKSRLSAVLRDAGQGPTIIHSRGRDLAVVLSVEDYELLLAERAAEQGGGATFLERVEALKERYGGGVDEFAPERIAVQPSDPFGRRAGKRR